MNILEFALAKKMGGPGGVPINNQDKTITQNGTYTADEGFTGLGIVKVSVARDDQTDIEDALNAVIARSITEISSNAASVGGSAFYDCSKLTAANFPVATEIYSQAFSGCYSLTTADFPAVTKIGIYAFYGCSKLTALILRSETMCAYGSNSFGGTPIASGTGYIYVHRALVDSYKAATNWSTYATQFRALEDYTVDGTTTGALDSTKI